MPELVVEKAAEGTDRVDEGLLVRIADLADHVPMAAARRDVRDRRAGGHPEEAALGIELIEHWVEVALVDPAAMEQDQRSLGFAGRLAVQVDELDDLPRALRVEIRRVHVGC